MVIRFLRSLASGLVVAVVTCTLYLIALIFYVRQHIVSRRGMSTVAREISASPSWVLAAIAIAAACGWYLRQRRCITSPEMSGHALEPPTPLS